MTNTTPEKQTLYQVMGGDAGIRSLVDQFYDLMDQRPEFAGMRKLHPASLDEARDKLYWYFSGWMGGPDRYVERFGHPRMRMRHAPFAIGHSEKQQWLDCMNLALRDTDIDESVKVRLMESFANIAEAVRNKDD